MQALLLALEMALVQALVQALMWALDQTPERALVQDLKS